MIIVYCIDENFTEYARISIASYRKNNPKAKIVVVSEKPLENTMGYDQNAIIKLKREFRGKESGHLITKSTYLKEFLPMLPYRKILYVDADTVCQKPLDELWKMPCQYINIPESHRYGKKQAQEFGIKKYGCAGVMVMNLPALRKIKFTQRCEDVEENLPTPKTGYQYDETCINVGMKGKLTVIDPKFGYCHNREYDNPIPEKDAYIIHYIGDDKKEMLSGENYIEIIQTRKDIQDKTVAIVGNARSIFDGQYGKEIDEHDFVIRFNKGFPRKKESQGSKTSFLILATDLTKKEMNSYKAKYVANRSRMYHNDAQMTIGDKEKRRIKNFIGKHPTTGFIAIDICLCFGAKRIDLYGFDFEKTPTFYNPEGYQTPHDYNSEKKIVEEYERLGLLKINR